MSNFWLYLRLEFAFARTFITIPVVYGFRRAICWLVDHRWGKTWELGHHRWRGCQRCLDEERWQA